jgi:hypothetical protein
VQFVIGVQMVHSNYRSFLSPEGYLVRRSARTASHPPAALPV